MAISLIAVAQVIHDAQQAVAQVPPTPREREKARYQAFQRAAQARAAASGGAIRVPTHPEVQQVEGGAFVEAMIWVPASAIQLETTPKPVKTP